MFQKQVEMYINTILRVHFAVFMIVYRDAYTGQMKTTFIIFVESPDIELKKESIKKKLWLLINETASFTDNELMDFNINDPVEDYYEENVRSE